MRYNLGVSVIIFKLKDDQVFILLGKRKGANGAGYWAFPGGHIEDDESVEECAIREVREETGLEIHMVHNFLFTDNYFPEINKKYITLFVVAGLADNSADPELCEPRKCERWEWHNIDNKDNDLIPLFFPIYDLKKLIALYKIDDPLENLK